MRTAIFGGTFNPVHNGHRNAVKKVLEAVELDRVIVLPDRIPPHKEVKELASEKDRLAMLELTFSQMPETEISDYELRREGKSYSVITLRHFHETLPEDKLFFIMGSDMLLTFSKWYCWQEILSLCTLICVSRCDEDTEKLEPCAQELRRCGGEVIIVSAEPFEVSSTQLREMIRKNEDCSCYLDESVVKYITDNNLYGRGI